MGTQEHVQKTSINAKRGTAPLIPPGNYAVTSTRIGGYFPAELPTMGCGCVVAYRILKELLTDGWGVYFIFSLSSSHKNGKS